MTLEANLARGMRQLNGVYAQWFNRRHHRVGHLFQGRYKAISIQTDAHLRRAVRYLIRNPIRARLSSRPDQWRWTSHHATVGSAEAGIVARTRLGRSIASVYRHPSPLHRPRERTIHRRWSENDLPLAHNICGIIPHVS